MKLSKIAWWILGIGIFVIAAAALLMVYSGQGSDEEQIEDSLTITQGLLTKLTADREEMTGQLAMLEEELDETGASFSKSKAQFPEDVESIEYDEELFLIADDCDLEVMSLIASEPRTQKMSETIIFTTTEFDVEVRGDVANILTFIDNVANGVYFTAATVELVNVEIPEPDLDELPVALIQLVIYSYEGE